MNKEKLQNIGMGMISGAGTGAAIPGAGVWGALGGAAVGGIMGGFQPTTDNLREKQLDQAQRLGDINTQSMLNYWDKTNFAAQVEQLKKAGLNPALLYGMGGEGGQVGGQAPSGHVDNLALNAMQMQDIAKQSLLLDTQIKNIEADTEKKQQDVKESGARIEDILKSAGLKDAQKLSVEIQTRINELLYYVKDKTKDIEVKEYLAKYNELEQKLYKLKLDNKLTSGTMQTVIDKVDAELKNLQSNTDLNEKLKVYYQNQADKVLQDMKIDIKRLNLDIDRNEWQKEDSWENVLIGRGHVENEQERNRI